MTYTVTQPDLAERRNAVLELWNRNLPEADPRRFGWLYEQGQAENWLLRSAEGSIVGSTGAMRRMFFFDGRPLTAGQAIDLNVDREHRSIGPAMVLQRTVVDTVKTGRFDLVYSFPNPASRAVMKRIGYREIGLVQRWVKPLRTGRLAAKRLRPPWLAGTVAWGADSALAMVSPEWRMRLPRQERFVECFRFDKRFDALARAATARFRIFGDRSAAYLTWRFGAESTANRRVFTLLDDAGELLAYLVFATTGGAANVNDFLFREPRHFETLLAAWIRQMRRERLERLVTTCFVPIETAEVFCRFHFLQRPNEWPVCIFPSERWTADQKTALLDGAHWFLTRADFDTDG